MLSEHQQLALLGLVFVGFILYQLGQHLEGKQKQRNETAGIRRSRIIQWTGLVLALVATTVVFYVRVIRHNR